MAKTTTRIRSPKTERILARETNVDDIIYFQGCRCRVVETDHGTNNVGTMVGRFRLESSPRDKADRSLPESFEGVLTGSDDTRIWIRETN